MYGPDLIYPFRDVLTDACRVLGAGFGLPAIDPLGALTIDPCPPALRLPAGYSPVGVRYIPYSGLRGVLTGPFGARSRPRVCITWGTTMARLDRRLFLVRRVIDAIAGLDIDLVAAITADQWDLLGPAADAVRTEQDVPLTEILRECDAVIAHGGAGTLLTASACGVPGLFVPRLPDHAANARQFQAAGAGIVLSHETSTAERIRQGLQALLERPDYRVAAGGLRDAMAACPVPGEIVRTLEEVAGTGRAGEPS